MKLRVRNYKTKKRTTIRDQRSQMYYERRVKFILFVPLAIAFLYAIVSDCNDKTEAKPETKTEIIKIEDAEPPSIEPVEAPAEPIIEKKELTIEDIIMKYFPDDYEVAVAVFKAENCYYQEPVGWKPLIVGDKNTPYHSVGIAQIRMLPERNLGFDWLVQPENNISYARELYDKYGWKPWTAYNKGYYKKYMSN